MSQCPKCNRSYSENFSYCLDDGTPLRHSTYDDATLVMPQPPSTTPTSASATAAAPAPAPVPRRQGSTTAVVIGVVGIVVVVILVGVFGLGFWLLDRRQNATNDNSNSSVTSTTATPSPTSSENPFSTLNGTPSPNPSASIEIPGGESMIGPGTYQCEITRTVGEGTKHTVAIKLRVTINIDGTYSTKGYMTIPEANIHDQLGIEEKGNYSQSDDTLILTNRRERQFDLDSGSWKAWGAPEDGSESREKIRNVTPNTFQMYDEDEKSWFTFSRI
jgi:hypothetical protein